MGAMFTHLVGAGLLPARTARLSNDVLTDRARRATRRRAWLHRLGERLRHLTTAMQDRRDAWRLYRELSLYDDHLLSDIGFSRGGLWRQVYDAVRRR